LTSDAPRAARGQGAQLCRALVFGLGLTGLAQIACAEEPRLEFNIPAQPLATALEQYGNITGRNALYNSNLLIGRRSTAVEGQIPPDVALTTLLGGTGLAASHVSPDSFFLLPAPVKGSAVVQPAVAQYYGRIQVRLQSALCSAGEARPGSYRIGMRLWIDDVGNVTRYERLTSTGASQVDASIDRAVYRLQIGAPPPPGLGQPVSIVIMPQAPGVTMGCVEPAIHRAGVAQ
jgi:TonB C terminal